MYEAAGSLDPDRIHDVARRCFTQMRNAGYTAVGEFHYVHHQPDGTPYARPNALAEAVCEAAEEVGIRIVLLLTAYERGGFDRPPDPGAAPVLRPDRRGLPGAARGPAAVGGRPAARDRRRRPPLRPRRVRGVAGADRRALRRPRSRAPSARRRAAARDLRHARRDRPAPGRADRARRRALPPHDDRPRHALRRRRGGPARGARRDGVRVPVDGGEPRRRLRAGGAADAGRRARSASGRTRTRCSIRWRSCASSSTSRGAPRCAATCSSPTAIPARRRTCWRAAGRTAPAPSASRRR